MTRSKFGVRTDAKGKEDRTVDGILFDSKREKRRYDELKIMLKLKLITNLRTQVKVELLPKQNGEKGVYWTADFMYNDAGGNEIWEDCKGMRTPLYVLKRKLVLFRHGKKILET